MPLAALTIDPRRLWTGEEWPEASLAFVDLDAARDWPESPVLPPFPVIGLGSSEHPLAHALDALVEPPVRAAGLVAQVQARPRAAAVAVQLLRLLTDLDTDAALAAESMAYGLLQGSAEHHDWLAARGAVSPPSAPGRVRVARRGDDMEIALDRAGQGNAIDRVMRDALREAFAVASLDPTVRRVLLVARGRSFSLGADLGEFGSTRDPASAHAIRMRSLPAPVIAACARRLEARVQGACIGAGLEMAAWAGKLVASRDAWFQLPELAMGILPGAGGCVSLSRRIGRQRTALMLLSGKRISAGTALGWGLVDALVDDLAADHGHADIAGIEP